MEETTIKEKKYDILKLITLKMKYCRNSGISIDRTET